MDVNRFVNEFEAKEGVSVFPDYTDAFYAEARDEIIAEEKIRRELDERKKQGAKG